MFNDFNSELGYKSNSEFPSPKGNKAFSLIALAIFIVLLHTILKLFSN